MELQGGDVAWTNLDRPPLLTQRSCNMQPQALHLLAGNVRLPVSIP
jgi:hypothetical protein